MPYCRNIYYFQHTDERAGKFPPLLLIHGAGGDHLSWPPEVRRLDGSHILAIDLPGHGKSSAGGEQEIEAYAARVHEWLEEMGQPQVVLAGHSMGGAIALSMALEYPECVRGMVLVGSGASLKVNPALLGMLADPDNYPQAVGLILRWSFSPQAPSSLVKLAARRITGADPGVLYQDLLACTKFDASARLAEVQIPTLVVCGTADKMTPMRLSEHLTSGIPGAQLEAISGAGHMVALEQPKAVAAALTKFLSSLDF